MRYEAYIEALNEAVRTLQRAEIEAFDALTKVALSSPGTEFQQLLNPDAVVELELSMFEHSNDKNLEALAGIVKYLCQVRKRLIHDNELSINLDDE